MDKQSAGDLPGEATCDLINFRHTHGMSASGTFRWTRQTRQLSLQLGDAAELGMKADK